MKITYPKTTGTKFFLNQYPLDNTSILSYGIRCQWNKDCITYI